MINLSAGEGRLGRYLAISGVLLVLGVLVIGVLIWFRGELRKRMIIREVAVMEKQVNAVLRQAEEAYLLSGEFLPEDELALLGNLADVPEYLVEALLGMLNVDRVEGLQVFDKEGFSQEALSAMEGMNVLPDHFFSGLKEGFSRGQLIDEGLELMIPLFRDGSKESDFLGVVTFYIDESELLAEYEGLDEQLVQLCLLLLVAGGGVIAWVLSVTFHRMESANELLEERGQRLAATNEKLLLATKTSAVGSLTANLIHGLKNPLGSLREYVNLLRETGGISDKEDVELARESVRRMQDLIQDTLSVIESTDGEAMFSFTLQELQGEIRKKLAPIAKSKDVELLITGEDLELEVDSVRGNLLVLILCNLGQNALEASPQGRVVRIEFTLETPHLHCFVRDEGQGLPEWMKSDPFQAVRSTKQGGSGIGLALSQQLSRQIEAEVELEESTTAGTVFKFSLRVA